MDKHLTKKLLVAEGLPTAAWDLFDLARRHAAAAAGLARPSARREAALRRLGVGVTIVKTHEAVDQRHAHGLEKRTDRFWPRSTSKVANLRAAILGEEALPIIEIIPNRDELLQPMTPKYEPGGSTHVVPAQDRRRSGGAHADARALDAPAARAAGLFAHRFHRQSRQRVRTFSRSTRCPA